MTDAENKDTYICCQDTAVIVRTVLPDVQYHDLCTKSREYIRISRNTCHLLPRKFLVKAYFGDCNRFAKWTMFLTNLISSKHYQKQIL